MSVKNTYLDKIYLPWIGAIQRRLSHTLWSNTNFRLFLLSEFSGIFGNHFYQIALPWLVMEFTGSAGAMSASIILSGISRIALMMVGGTLSDRFSPRLLMFTAAGFRALLLILITGLAMTGRMSLVFLYGFSFASGLADAISLPARGAVLPLLVEGELLKAANAIASAQEKLWSLVGPAMAGLVITWLNRTTGANGTTYKSFLGPAAAFVIDIIAIAISVLILRLLKFPSLASQSEEEELPPAEPIEIATIFSSIRDLISLIRQKASLRMSFLMVYLINIISSGPLYIGLPMLAVSRFSEGAQVLGFMSSALGCGALLGTLLAGVLPQPQPNQMGRMFLVMIGIMGAGFAVLITVVSIGVNALAVLVIAAMISYINVTGIVQIQRDTPPSFMGRMMGLLNMK